jgi:hypothetical protein
MRRTIAGLVLAALVLPLLPVADRAEAAWVFTTNTTREIDQNQPGGQFAPALAPNSFNGGFLATWLNARSSADVRSFARYFSSSAIPIGLADLQMGYATGLTLGVPSSSAWPVVLTNGNALTLFASDRRGATAADKHDIFAQPLSQTQGPSKIGFPKLVNQMVAGVQTQVFAERLSTGAVGVVWLTHGAAAASYDIHSRILNVNGAGAYPEKVSTLFTNGQQALTDYAPLFFGTSVIAYTVKIPTSQGPATYAYVQRLDAAGNRLGNPTLIKGTLGANTYGGAGLAALSDGRYIAVWFVAGSAGNANLVGRIFSPVGVPSAPFFIGTSRIIPSLPNGPKVAQNSASELVMITDGYASGVFSLNGWLLNASNVRLIGPAALATSTANYLTVTSLISLSNQNFALSYLQAGSSALLHRSFVKVINPINCGRC